jgi:hypothetical protein
MNPGPFAYLLSGGSTQAAVKTAADRLEHFSKLAAKRYIEERAPLNETIMKIAKENELNRHQIERVCEMANIATHQGLWTKTAQKDKISFPLADAKIVTAGCNCDQAPDPCGDGGGGGGDIDSDYAGPPKGMPGMGPSIASMMGVDPNGGHNGLTAQPERTKIIVMLQKKAAERDRLKSATIMNGAILETLEKKAWNAVKQTVLGGESFRHVYAAAVGVGLAKVAAEYLPKFQERLISEVAGSVRARLEKTAISPAPEELISENLGNMNVINGAHPVLVLLDTVQKKTGEIKNGLFGLLRIDDELKVLNQRLKELS